MLGGGLIIIGTLLCFTSGFVMLEATKSLMNSKGSVLIGGEEIGGGEASWGVVGGDRDGVETMVGGGVGGDAVGGDAVGGEGFGGDWVTGGGVVGEGFGGDGGSGLSNTVTLSFSVFST